MRLAAVEQGGEQALEMGVHRLEGGEQADAPFAVEVADRPAQPVHRLLQFLDLGRVPFALAVEFDNSSFARSGSRGAICSGSRMPALSTTWREPIPLAFSMNSTLDSVSSEPRPPRSLRHIFYCAVQHIR